MSEVGPNFFFADLDRSRGAGLGEAAFLRVVMQEELALGMSMTFSVLKFSPVQSFCPNFRQLATGLVAKFLKTRQLATELVATGF